jgi:hypothetical protein
MSRMDLGVSLNKLVGLGYECYLRVDNHDEGVIVSHEGDLVRLSILEGNSKFESELEMSYTYIVMDKASIGSKEKGLVKCIVNPKHSRVKFKLDSVFSEEDLDSVIKLGLDNISKGNEYEKCSIEYFKVRYMKWDKVYKDEDKFRIEFRKL